MIDREYVWVCGPPGAGKTSLVERVLESNRARSVVAGRFRADEEAVGATGTVTFTEEEERYVAAGADQVFGCRYPPGSEVEAESWYWDTTWERGPSDVVLYEGAGLPGLHPDLAVHVMAADSEAIPLLTRAKRVIAHVPLEDYLIAAAAAGSGRDDADGQEHEDPDEATAERTVAEGEGEAVDQASRLELVSVDEGEEEVIKTFDVPEEQARRILEWAEHGVPLSQKVWVLHDRHADLVHARFVVVNVRDDSERPLAERITREVERIWSDEEVRRDVVRYSPTRRPPTVQIANLANRRDPGTRKAVARIKRAMRPR